MKIASSQVFHFSPLRSLSTAQQQMLQTGTLLHHHTCIDHEEYQNFASQELILEQQLLIRRSIFSLDSLRLPLSSPSINLPSNNISLNGDDSIDSIPVTVTVKECDLTVKECDLTIETINLALPHESESSLTKSFTTCSDKSIKTDESCNNTKSQSFDDVTSHCTQSDANLFKSSRQKKRIQRYYTEHTKLSPPTPTVAKMLGPGSVSKSFSLYFSSQDMWLSSPLDQSDCIDDATAQAAYWSHSFHDEHNNENENSCITNSNSCNFEHDPLRIDIVDLPTFNASDAAPLTSICSDKNSGFSGGWWSPDLKQLASKNCSTFAPSTLQRHHGRQQHSLQRALHLNSSMLSEVSTVPSVPLSSSSLTASSNFSPAGTAFARQHHIKSAWSDNGYRQVDNRLGPGSCSKEMAADGWRRQQLLTNLLIAVPGNGGTDESLSRISDELNENSSDAMWCPKYHLKDDDDSGNIFDDGSGENV